MNNYRVTWEIDIYANNPREAALSAQAIQRRRDTTATVFTVSDDDGNKTIVDLLAEQEAS